MSSRSRREVTRDDGASTWLSFPGISVTSAGMKTVFHEQGDRLIVELQAEGVLLETAQDALDLMMNLTSSEVHKIILHRDNVSEAFFDLKTGLAGEVLQKFVNYRVQVAIVGDFSDLDSESFQAFLRESNRGRQNFFADDVETAVALLFAADLTSTQA